MPPLQSDFDKAFFQQTFSSFLTQIFTKQISINKLEMDLLRKCEGKTETPSSHMPIIRACRKSIDSIDGMLRDLKDYFEDLRIGELYGLVENVFRVLVYNVKKISECYLKRFQAVNKMQEQKQDQLQQQQQSKDQCICVCKLTRKQIAKKLEHFDFQIQQIQEKEQQLVNQMNFLISDLAEQKQKVQKISVNRHGPIFTEIQNLFVEISRKAECMFNNYYKNILEEQNRATYLEPQAFDQQVFWQLKTGIQVIAKEKILKMQKMLNVIYKNKQREKQERKKKEMDESSQKDRHESKGRKSKRLSFNPNKPRKMRSYQIQLDGNKKQEADNIYDNQQLNKQLQNLRKTVKSLSLEILDLKQKSKKQMFQNLRINNQNKQYKELLHRKAFQFQQSKSEMRNLMDKNTREALRQISIKFQNQDKHLKSVGGVAKNSVRGYIKVESKEEKEVQTDPCTFGPDPSNYNESFVFEHKAFFPSRSKYKKRSSNQKKSIQVQKSLKQTITRISEFLFDKDKNQQKVQQRTEVENLLKQQKYDHIIVKIKGKLDAIFETSKQQKQNREQQMMRSIVEKKGTKRKKRNTPRIFPLKSIKKDNDRKFAQLGVQTMQGYKQAERQPIFHRKQSRKLTTTRFCGNQIVTKPTKSSTKNNRSKMSTILTTTESQPKMTPVESIAGLKSDRMAVGRSHFRNSQMNQRKDSTMLSRFHPFQQYLQTPNQPSVEQSSKIRKSNFFQNALFQQLLFDSSTPKPPNKRQSQIQKFTQDKHKSNIMKASHRDSLMDQVRDSVIKERDDEEMGGSTKMLDVQAKKIESSETIGEEAMLGQRSNARKPSKFQHMRHQSQI